MIKFIIGIALLIAITELLIPSIFNLNQGILTGVINSSRLNISNGKQIEIQKRESRERTLPQTGEILRMQKDKNLCFQNDDCRIDPESLVDCETPIHNKYFSCTGTVCANDSNAVCMSDYMYFVCENNKCVKKPIEL